MKKSLRIRIRAHQKLLGDGVLTPVPLFTIILNKAGIFDQYQNMPQVPAARSFLVAGFDTNVIPRSFSCGESSENQETFSTGKFDPATGVRVKFLLNFFFVGFRSRSHTIYV